MRAARPCRRATSTEPLISTHNVTTFLSPSLLAPLADDYQLPQAMDVAQRQFHVSELQVWLPPSQTARPLRRGKMSISFKALMLSLGWTSSYVTVAVLATCVHSNVPFARMPVSSK